MAGIISPPETLELSPQLGWAARYVDGILGPKTKAAIRSFQQFEQLDDEGLEATSHADWNRDQQWYYRRHR